MVESSRTHPLFFILGPTAVGKSNLALRLALKYHGGIANFDSLQFFKDVNIGTAKPSLEERNLCPHFLFDICEVGGEFTAGQFRKMALSVIESHEKKYPLFFVGGSGFYLQALEKGMYPVAPIPQEIDLQTDKDLKEQGLNFLFQELTEKDPVYAKKIGPNDQYRIYRAINLLRAFGKPISEIMQQHKQQMKESELKREYYKIGLFLEREILRQRVEERTLKMLSMGWLEEATSLISRVGSEWPPLSSVGYKEVILHLKNEIGYDEMLEKIITNTMRLAKRQMTWFKKESNIQWFHALEDPLKIEQWVDKKLHKEMK